MKFLNKQNLFCKSSKDQTGAVILFEMILIFVFSLIMLVLLSTAVMQLRVLRSTIVREQALQIAEAGIHYYQWHLANFLEDYENGTGGPPGLQADFGRACYSSEFREKLTNTPIGKYCLVITPPVTGSTIVTIEAYGYSYENPAIKRKITAAYGIPSLAKYSALTNNNIWVGEGENVYGAVHANGGVRFDGTTNATVSSAKTTYSCNSTFGCSPTATKPGVWSNTATQTTRNFWKFPVPVIDFSSLTSDFAEMKAASQTAGRYLAPSNANGYSLVFNASGTVSVYRVQSLRSHSSGYDVEGAVHNEYIDYNTRTLLYTTALPDNGIIFAEDTVWVEGVVNGRVTVAAAKLPYNKNSAPSIIIPNNLVYASRTGTNSLGLIAQKNVLVSFYAPTNLTVEAAMIAQTGSVQRYFYSGNTKTNLQVFGSIMSNGIWTWSWANSSGIIISGYVNNTATYDDRLLYMPPPKYPLSNDGYQEIKWTSD